MDYAIDELCRSLRYHQRQLDENLTEIQRKEEAIDLLKSSNEKHKEIIQQIEQAIEMLKAE